MPIFEYRCDDCGNKFEKLLRSSAREAAAQCPCCGHDRVTTQVSIFAARTHGSAEDSAPHCASGRCVTPEWCGRN